MNYRELIGRLLDTIEHELTLQFIYYLLLSAVNDPDCDDVVAGAIDSLLAD